ncbi:MAG: metal ABC transporter permease [Candidatus Jorgensenbacteria bacterium]
MPDTFILALISGILVAAASGFVGSFLVLRRMTLLADALSHVALPGIALGVLLNFQPLLGGLAFLFLAVFAIWGIEHKTKLAVESITGVLFVTALAVGALLIPQSELLEAFFGSVERATPPTLLLQMLIAIAVIGLAARYLKPLVLSSIAPDLAIAAKLSYARMELLLLILIALTTAIGVSFMGVLLMSALTIIPAVTARNLSRNYKVFLSLSILLAVVSLEGGLLAAQYYSLSPGIATVLIAAFFFAVSLCWKK